MTDGWCSRSVVFSTQIIDIEFRDTIIQRIWSTTRHSFVLGREVFVHRHGMPPRPAEYMCASPRAQHRALAGALAELARRSPLRAETMAQALQAGVYTVQEIADHFRVHSSTVSRAVRRSERGTDPVAGLPAQSKRA